jgi:hypothetical protein
MDVDKHLSGLRTLFTSFHHFKPNQAKAILEDATKKNEPIAVFEFTERKFSNYFIQPIAATLAIWITTPFIRPFKLSRLFFTYIVPLVPLMTVWDGYISNLRTYSVNELNQMIESLNADHYEWETGLMKTKQPGINITYLLGLPRETVDQGRQSPATSPQYQPQESIA